MEIGSHEGLLERRGLYTRLFEQQFAKVLNLNGVDRTAGVDGTRTP